jgi:hypothetical protein
MQNKQILSGVFAAILAAFICAPPALAQATRTWVSGVGDDANPCSRIAPCKTFAGAISKTAPAGEIDCLDPGGFGAVTITKSITLDCTGTFGSILVSGTNAIVVSGSGIVVRLRGLTLQGVTTGINGINALSMSELFVENCVFFGFSAGAGIRFAPASGVGKLFVKDTFIETGGSGIVIAPSGGATAGASLSNVSLQGNGTGMSINTASGAATVELTNSLVAANSTNGITVSGTSSGILLISATTVVNNSGSGISAGSSSSVFIGGTSIVGNSTGVSVTGNGAVRSYKNNLINANTVDASPALPLIGTAQN